MSESIGSFLKRERELRRISLSELSEHTRVKLEYLEAIEAEHFERIPGLTFAKGYLKAYADYVGLNSEEVLLRFQDMLNRLAGSFEPERPKANLKAFWILTFLLLTLAAVGVVLWLKR